MILIDEFEPGKLMGSVLKRMTDGYPCTLPGRGVSKTWRGKSVLFTSQMDPREWFKDSKGQPSVTDYKAFARRCKGIWHCGYQVWTPEIVGRSALTGIVSAEDAPRFQPFGNPYDQGTVFSPSSPAWIVRPAPSSSSAGAAIAPSSGPLLLEEMDIGAAIVDSPVISAAPALGSGAVSAPTGSASGSSSSSSSATPMGAYLD